MSGAAPLDGKRAVVTGGTRGIGAAVAERLLADGAEVIVTGTRPVGTAPEGCVYHGVDFTDRHAAEAFAREVAAREPHILVNSAGINKIAPFEQIDSEDFDRIQQVNLRAPFLLCRAALPSMRRRGWGRIVNICSIWGTIGKEQRGSYTTSKFALDGMTMTLALEAAADGVLANCVSPGFVDTDMTRTVLGEAGIAELVARVPARRLAAPAEVAALVAWLAGPENTYLTAQNVVIDGGFTRS